MVSCRCTGHLCKSEQTSPEFELVSLISLSASITIMLTLTTDIYYSSRITISYLVGNVSVYEIQVDIEKF